MDSSLLSSVCIYIYILYHGNIDLEGHCKSFRQVILTHSHICEKESGDDKYNFSLHRQNEVIFKSLSHYPCSLHPLVV